MTVHRLYYCDPGTFHAGYQSWRFYCRFCDTHHTHGAYPGHRVAHCTTEAGKAAHEDGYILALHPRHKVQP